MIILRLLGILIIFGITTIISAISKIDIMTVLIITTFILTSDTFICNLLVRKFIKVLADEQNKKRKE